MKIALCLALLLVAFSCASTKEKEGQSASQTPPRNLQDFLKAARALPTIEGEDFQGFALRAHQTLRHEDESDLSDARADVLLAIYARRQATDEAAEFLAKMISHKTVNAEGVKIPGRGPAFDGMENDLKTFAEKNELAFFSADHVAHEIALEDKSDKKRVAILVHGDVVPAQEPGWTRDAFEGVVTKDRVLGRGALDDKGAMVAALFALKHIREAGAQLDKNPMLIVGSSEETHWTGIEHYLKVRGVPEKVFVADGGFPVGIGEKGTATLKIEVKREEALPPFSKPILGKRPLQMVRFWGGQVANQVPGAASVVLRMPPKDEVRKNAMIEEAKGHDFSVETLENGDLKISVLGVAAHGSTPQEGKNAISPLVRFLVVHAALQDDACARLLDALDSVLDAGFEGARLGMTSSHPRFSVATANLGVVRADDKTCSAKINLRWPPSDKGGDTSSSAVVAAASDIFKDEAQDRFVMRIEGSGLDPFLVSEDSDLVQKLQETFVLLNGPSAETTVTLSGTTYAKAVPGAVTFGPSRKGVAGSRIHGANEYITLDELGDLVELYTHALLSLSRDDVVCEKPADL